MPLESLNREYDPYRPRRFFDDEKKAATTEFSERSMEAHRRHKEKAMVGESRHRDAFGRKREKPLSDLELEIAKGRKPDGSIRESTHRQAIDQAADREEKIAAKRPKRRKP